MAHKKAGGSTALGRDSQGQRLGVKVYGGSKINAGMVILRQRGAAYRAGANVKIGRDDTLYAATDGVVRFQKKQLRSFHGKAIKRSVVNVDLKK
jgi:large subunit ribosomal protein L27